MVDLEGTRLTPDERELLCRPEVGGVIFFSRNFAGREQFCDLVATVRQLRAELLLAVDQEGGRVQRLRQGYTRIPPMRLLGRYFSRDHALGSTLLRSRRSRSVLRSVGISERSGIREVWILGCCFSMRIQQLGSRMPLVYGRYYEHSRRLRSPHPRMMRLLTAPAHSRSWIEMD